MSRKIPNNVHKLNGTYRRDRHGQATEPVLSPDYPDTPDYVVKYPGALVVWNQIKSVMQGANIYTRAEGNKLARYCILEAEFRNNPLAFSEMSTRLTQLRLLENDLYLSPESRARIGGKKNEQVNRFSDY